MSVRRYRDVEEMAEDVWLAPGSAELAGAIRAVFEVGTRLAPWHPPAGVHRFASIEEMSAQRARWERETTTPRFLRAGSAEADSR